MMIHVGQLFWDPTARPSGRMANLILILGTTNTGDLAPHGNIVDTLLQKGWWDIIGAERQYLRQYKDGIRQQKSGFIRILMCIS